MLTLLINMLKYNPKTFEVLTNFGTNINKIIRIEECSNKGKISFTINNNEDRIFIKGQYAGASTLTINSHKDEKTANRVTSSGPKKYYKPFKKGRWEYFNSNGDFLKVELYHNGLLSKKAK